MSFYLNIILNDYSLLTIAALYHLSQSEVRLRFLMCRFLAVWLLYVCLLPEDTRGTWIPGLMVKSTKLYENRLISKI